MVRLIWAGDCGDSFMGCKNFNLPNCRLVCAVYRMSFISYQNLKIWFKIKIWISCFCKIPYIDSTISLLMPQERELCLGGSKYLWAISYLHFIKRNAGWVTEATSLTGDLPSMLVFLPAQQKPWDRQPRKATGTVTPLDYFLSQWSQLCKIQFRRFDNSCTCSSFTAVVMGTLWMSL